MEHDGTRSRPDSVPERDAALEIQESFQAILDALDAARAELRAEGRNRRTGGPPRSSDRHGEPAAYGGRAVPAKVLSPEPAPRPPAARPRAHRTGPRSAGLVPVPPQGVPRSVVNPPRTGPVRRPAQEPLVQPLWSHGARQEAEKQPTTGDPGSTRDEPSAPRPSAGPVRAGGRPGTGPSPDASWTTSPSPDACWTTGPSPDASWTADPGRSAARTAPLDAPPRQAPARPDAVRLPVPKGSPGHRRSADRRHARVAGFFGLGAVSGILLASSLLTHQHSEPAAPPAAREQPERPLPDDTPLPEIPGTGVLREGDSGHGVYELQVRLLQIPGLYDGGAIDGRFGTEVRQAVARFQKRFAIQGDDTGVYGDNTRYALMLRTK